MKSSLRKNHYLMEPEELTPEERLDRIVELLAAVCMDLNSKEEAKVLNEHVEHEI